MIPFTGWIPIIGIFIAWKPRGESPLTRMFWCFWHFGIVFAALVILVKECRMSSQYDSNINPKGNMIWIPDKYNGDTATIYINDTLSYTIYKKTNE